MKFILICTYIILSFKNIINLHIGVSQKLPFYIIFIFIYLIPIDLLLIWSHILDIVVKYKLNREGLMTFYFIIIFFQFTEITKIEMLKHNFNRVSCFW